MLDVRATTGTPGAITVALLANLVIIVANDGSPVAGVPVKDTAKLIAWGSQSLIANTVSAARLISQDLVDPINGETVNLGAASLQNQFYKWANLPYKTGSRIISQSTNTAQTATSIAFTVDYYANEGGMRTVGREMRFAPNCIVIPQLLNADVAIAWTNTGLAPATAIPNGVYALLGVWATLMTEAHVLRFNHADFGFCKPGFPLVGSFNSAILGFQKSMKDPLATDPGYQFVALSDLTGIPCCPVFRVSNAGTGLTIDSLAAAATDTPSLQINLAKIG